jgi:hypothetical protein
MITFKHSDHIAAFLPTALTASAIDKLVALKEAEPSTRIYSSEQRAQQADAYYDTRLSIKDLKRLKARFVLYAEGLINEGNQEEVSFKEAYYLLDYSPESGKVTWKQRSNPTVDAGSPAGFEHSSGQHLIKMKNNVFRLNRVIWLLQTGSWPRGRIKHRDGNNSNLRWTNLYEEGGR